MSEVKDHSKVYIYIPPHTMEFMIEHQLLLEMSDKCLQLSCITPIYISTLIQVGKSTYSTLQKMKCERINHVNNSNGIFRMHSNFKIKIIITLHKTHEQNETHAQRRCNSILKRRRSSYVWVAVCVKSVLFVHFYKHHNCILYTTACIHIPQHVYIYIYIYIYIPQHVYIIYIPRTVYYIPRQVYMYTKACIHLFRNVYSYTCNYNELGMHVP